MHAASPEHRDIVLPPRARPWAAIAISAAITAVYAVVLAAPTLGGNSEREYLHTAVARIGEVIQAVEASYADGDLRISDQHLGLPASAAFCRQLRMHLPDTGHARLRCELRGDGPVRGTLALQRTPQGAWRCMAEVPDPQLLPAACRP
ncbi:pilin [Stenotrophomonas sp. PFBMAA-4]|uniref:pilin n=1 Tax=Stenotrophomonas sp. PFBMAA-4 TaxID=3043301 RepID=UPI0024B5EB9B|nr:pilin [Stenotrophomonas sp. PFBMAA-4]MDI9274957.1 pilin [Stenotrophomonas sp. PFBMAA-4]